MIKRAVFDRLLASLYAAALDDTHWSTAAALIGEVCRTKSHALGCGEQVLRAEGQVLFARFSDRDGRREDWEHKYFKTYWPRDESILRLRRLPDGQLVHGGDLYTDREKKTSLVYNEILRDTEAQNGIRVCVAGPKGLRIAWTLGDSIDSRGWESDQIATIERLLPHVRHFTCVRLALADAEALGRSLAEVLDNTRLAVIQLDRRGKITAANERARSLLRHDDRLRDRGGILRARTLRANAELQGLLARALPLFGEKGVGGSMIIGHRPGQTPLVVHIHPVGARQTDYGAWRVAALVLIVDPGSLTRIDPGVVAETLRLTPVESRVAVSLAAGRTVREIATAAGCSESTVRSHLKQIFRKQGISRQAELIRRVLSLDGFLREPRR